QDTPFFCLPHTPEMTISRSTTNSASFNPCVNNDGLIDLACYLMPGIDGQTVTITNDVYHNNDSNEDDIFSHVGEQEQLFERSEGAAVITVSKLEKIYPRDNWANANSYEWDNDNITYKFQFNNTSTSTEGQNLTIISPRFVKNNDEEQLLLVATIELDGSTATEEMTASIIVFGPQTIELTIPGTTETNIFKEAIVRLQDNLIGMNLSVLMPKAGVVASIDYSDCPNGADIGKSKDFFDRYCGSTGLITTIDGMIPRSMTKLAILR